MAGAAQGGLGWFGLEDGEAAPGTADRLLAALAAELAAGGLRLAGAIQRNTDLGADCACDMDLLVIGEEDRPVRISQPLGPGSTGCRLDAGALETAVARVAARMAGADLLLVPKFGRQEAIGRGFRELIGQALGAGLPVILHVPPEQRTAFADFAGGLDRRLAPGDLAAWCRAAAST